MDFIQAAIHGDKLKIAVLTLIALSMIAIPVVRWMLYRRRAKRMGWPLDGSVPADTWKPPDSDEVRRILKGHDTDS
jgi:hypothetical protein